MNTKKTQRINFVLVFFGCFFFGVPWSGNEYERLCSGHVKVIFDASGMITRGRKETK